jgi:hypothetical protein
LLRDADAIRRLAVDTGKRHAIPIPLGYSSPINSAAQGLGNRRKSIPECYRDRLPSPSLLDPWDSGGSIASPVRPPRSGRTERPGDEMEHSVGGAVDPNTRYRHLKGGQIRFGRLRACGCAHGKFRAIEASKRITVAGAGGSALPPPFSTPPPRLFAAMDLDREKLALQDLYPQRLPAPGGIVLSTRGR